jgi:hypothetical protein
MTTEQIRYCLKHLANVKCNSSDEAVIFMIISHGRDEKVLGYDYYKNKDKGDFIGIQEIVGIFSEKNCKTLSRVTPKLFFINCCRISISLKQVSILQLILYFEIFNIFLVCESSTKDEESLLCQIEKSDDEPDGSLSGDISIDSVEGTRDIPKCASIGKEWGTSKKIRTLLLFIRVNWLTLIKFI